MKHTPSKTFLLGTHAKVISFNASISACEKAEQWQLAIHLLQEALQSVQARFHDLKLVGFGLRAVMMKNFSWKRTCTCNGMYVKAYRERVREISRNFIVTVTLCQCIIIDMMSIIIIIIIIMMMMMMFYSQLVGLSR